MKRTNAVAFALATLLLAATANAERPDEIQAPLGQDQQAPRDRQDDLQAPRGHDTTRTPRGLDVQAPGR